jgi:HPt (histidine-containing phosphotransfer) domain-containing protein
LSDGPKESMMGNSKKIDSVAVSTFADHEVIVPPNKLKKAVVKKTGTDVDPVSRAEQALADLSSEFTQGMEMERRRLDAARNQAKHSGLSSKSREELFRAAHDIKGQAATLGFPLIAPVAESLCRLIEHTPEPTRIPLTLSISMSMAYVPSRIKTPKEMPRQQPGSLTDYDR